MSWFQILNGYLSKHKRVKVEMSWLRNLHGSLKKPKYFHYHVT